MKKNLYESQFKGKKITIMGLGVLGRGLQVTQFLADCGAKLTVTDLKNKKDLTTSLKSLKKYKIKYTLGKHDIKDFEKKDMIVKAAGVPLDSQYVRHAKSLNIPIVMDASLFAKVVKDVNPPIAIIGITGTRGKSMTTALIYHILKTNEKILGCKVHLGGNMRMKATLPLLRKVLPKDIVVLELDSWQCQGFGDEHISPQIAVFTNLMPDHMNYYKDNMNLYLKDKCNIFKFQSKKDTLVTNKEMLKILPNKPNGKVILSDIKQVPKTLMNIFGDHNIQNASYAYSVAKQCGLSDIAIQKALKSFPGLEGRLELLSVALGVYIINDNNSTTPEATIAGIKAVRSRYKNSGIILIGGGADKKLKIETLPKEIKKNCKAVILLAGTGTDNLKKILHTNYTEHNTLKQAVSEAFSKAKKGDVILFSPGFASFGLFKNEYDRNDQFIKIIKLWK